MGAGNAPYRELFEHAEYVTIDWGESIHEEAQRSDVIASAESIPVASASFDCVLMTQVLEHVPSPDAVLAEMYRLLRPGGTIAVTVPLAWELHELPHDYFRFTARGLEVSLERAGFEAIGVKPRNDCFTTIAQLVQNVGWTMGERAGRPRPPARGRAQGPGRARRAAGGTRAARCGLSSSRWATRAPPRARWQGKRRPA